MKLLMVEFLDASWIARCLDMLSPTSTLLIANREGTYKLLLEKFMRQNNVYRSKKDLIQMKCNASLPSWGTEYKQLKNAPKVCLFDASFKNSVAVKKLVGDAIFE